MVGKKGSSRCEPLYCRGYQVNTVSSQRVNPKSCETTLDSIALINLVLVLFLYKRTRI